MSTQPIVDNVVQTAKSQLIANHISDISNIQSIKSETVIKDILKSYSDKFAALGDQLTTLTRLAISERSLISKDQINDIITSLYIDLKSLYLQLDVIDEQINLNLTRNKNFFAILKRRSQELNNQIHEIQVNVTDSSIYDETFYESFSNAVSSHKYENLVVDKKSGLLKLNPVDTKYQNGSFLIKEIKSTVLPFVTDDGGVVDSTSELNTFEYNYSRNNLKDLLINGLWKHQLFCKDIPIIKYNINPDEAGVPRYIKTTGIVAIVDIEFTRPVDINTLNVDLYGEFKTDLLAFLYAVDYLDETDPDNPVLKTKWPSVTVNNRSSIIGRIDKTLGTVSNYDFLQINNINHIQTNKIRLVFNQKHFTQAIGSNNAIEDITTKVVSDLSEKRLSPVETKLNFNDGPGSLDSIDFAQLKSKIFEIIESTSDIQHTLNEIILLLDPVPKLNMTDISKLLKYELGAWEISPAYNTFSGSGVFTSNPYTLSDKSLLGVSIISKQTEPFFSSVNWEIMSADESKSFPVLERNKAFRVESVRFVDDPYYTELGYTEGSIVTLDFPLDVLLLPNMKFYINKVEKSFLDFMNEGEIYFFNSRTFYIHGFSDISKYTYLIKYVPAIYESCALFTLKLNKSLETYNDLPKNISFVSKEIATTFLNALSFEIDDKTIVDSFTINKHNITISEWNSLFNGKSIALTHNVGNYSTSVNNCITNYFSNSTNLYSNNRLVAYNSSDYNQMKVSFNLTSIKPSVYFS